MAKKKGTKNPKVHSSRGSNNVNTSDNDDFVDERFNTSKPVFQSSSYKTSAQDGGKVVLDERFSGILTDPRFEVNVRDKYGRRKKKKDKKKKKKNSELDAFYAVATSVDNGRNKDNKKAEENNNNDKNDSNTNKYNVDNDSDSDSCSETNIFRPGDKVMIQGLERANHLNGTRVRLTQFYRTGPHAGRWGTAATSSDDDEDNNKSDIVTTGNMAVKPQNLSLPEFNSSDDGGDGDSDDDSNNAEATEKSNEEEANKSCEKDDEEEPTSRIAYLKALSRGELDLSSSSSSDSDDDDDDDDESQSSSDDDSESSVVGSDKQQQGQQDDENSGENLGILDPASQHHGVDFTDRSSPFLAVQNLDWSHIRAVDILALLSSFSPVAAVKRVQVFASDFGIERMAEEERLGPTGLWKRNPEPTGEDKGDEIGMGDNESNDGSKNDSVEAEQYGARDDEYDYDSDDYDDDDIDGLDHLKQQPTERVESDFDTEKLRAYEASKLKYYFAVVEFSQPHHADLAYKELDGMEFEHSSAAMDLRSMAPEDVTGVVKDRPLRDEATKLPSNYVPPDFIVGALQQTNVQCTWEVGDRNRQRDLTLHATSGQAWESMVENDNLRAYLASGSDVSSDDDSNDGSDDSDIEDREKKKKKKNAGENSKAKRMRKMLGLDSDDDSGGGSATVSSSSESSSESSVEDNDKAEEDQAKEVRFIPGNNLGDKIRSKLESKDKANEHLTPWEKYQQKRKDKRREKRQAIRAKRKEINELRKVGTKANGQREKDNASEEDDGDDDNFFINEDNSDEEGESNAGAGKNKGANDKPRRQQQPVSSTGRMTKGELELLVAGEEGEAKDFDIRGLERMEKNKGKKLRGSRKRKEEERAASVIGTDFQVDLKDDRFRAVLDGQDDRFGIDRTAPSYKNTAAMKEILAEQTRRRKKAKRIKGGSPSLVTTTSLAPTVTADDDSSQTRNSGAAALSVLVKSIKSKVQQQ